MWGIYISSYAPSIPVLACYYKKKCHLQLTILGQCLSLLRGELATGNLAFAYILDNEIADDPMGMQGGEFATQIIDRSLELRRPTLVATLFYVQILQM